MNVNDWVWIKGPTSAGLPERLGEPAKVVAVEGNDRVVEVFGGGYVRFPVSSLDDVRAHDFLRPLAAAELGALLECSAIALELAPGDVMLNVTPAEHVKFVREAFERLRDVKAQIKTIDEMLKNAKPEPETLARRIAYRLFDADPDGGPNGDIEWRFESGNARGELAVREAALALALAHEAEPERETNPEGTPIAENATAGTDGTPQ